MVTGRNGHGPKVRTVYSVQDALEVAFIGQVGCERKDAKRAYLDLHIPES